MVGRDSFPLFQRHHYELYALEFFVRRVSRDYPIEMFTGDGSYYVHWHPTTEYLNVDFKDKQYFSVYGATSATDFPEAFNGKVHLGWAVVDGVPDVKDVQLDHVRDNVGAALKAVADMVNLYYYLHCNIRKNTVKVSNVIFTYDKGSISENMYPRTGDTDSSPSFRFLKSNMIVCDDVKKYLQGESIELIQHFGRQQT